MTFNIKFGLKKWGRSSAWFMALTVALTCSMGVSADQQDQVENTPAQLFFISAVLQRPDDITAVKIVHSVEAGRTSTEAEKSFASQLDRNFPEYTVLTTLISSVNSITDRPHVKSSSWVSI